MGKESIYFYARIDKKGRILIPKEIRDFHDIVGGETVKVTLQFKEVEE